MVVDIAPHDRTPGARQRSALARCSTRRSSSGPLVDSFLKLNPSRSWKNPVIFVVEVVSAVVTIRIVIATS